MTLLDSAQKAKKFLRALLWKVEQIILSPSIGPSGCIGLEALERSTPVRNRKWWEFEVKTRQESFGKAEDARPILKLPVTMLKPAG